MVGSYSKKTYLKIIILGIIGVIILLFALYYEEVSIFFRDYWWVCLIIVAIVVPIICAFKSDQ